MSPIRFDIVEGDLSNLLKLYTVMASCSRFMHFQTIPDLLPAPHELSSSFLFVWLFVIITNKQLFLHDLPSSPHAATVSIIPDRPIYSLET